MEAKVLILLFFPSKEISYQDLNIGQHLCCGLFYIYAISDCIAQVVKICECWFEKNLESTWSAAFEVLFW